MINLSTLPNEEVRPEMDDLLHDYFKAEMPHPWPTFKAPKPLRHQRPTSNSFGRLALAACIALLIAGYLALSGYFPHTQTNDGVRVVQPGIATKDGKPRQVVPMPQEDQVMPMELDSKR